MKLSIVAGATSQSVNVFIADSSSTTGAGLTALAYNTSGLTAYYSFSGANATATAITLATLATVTTAWSSGGFIEISATNMPGWYRLDIPNAVLATAKGRSVALLLEGATNMAPCPIEIELTAWDNQDGVRGGMTAFPNVASGSAGSIITSGTGTAQISTSSGLVTLSGVTFPTNFSALAITASTGLVKLDLTEALSAARNVGAVADTSLTLNDAFHCAIAAAAGQEIVSGLTYTVKTPSTATTLRSFTLDSSSAPTQRT